jgi:hypothetical protein
MLVDNLLPELKLKQSNILNMGDLILTSKTKTLGFQNLWSTHSVVSKFCLKSQENMNLGAAWNKSSQLAWYFLRRTT